MSLKTGLLLLHDCCHVSVKDLLVLNFVNLVNKYLSNGESSPSTSGISQQENHLQLSQNISLHGYQNPTFQSSFVRKGKPYL